MKKRKNKYKKKKEKRKKLAKKYRKKRNALWIAVGIHSALCVGEQ
jgi:hypothetical protein